MLLLGAGTRTLADNQNNREQALKIRIAELEEEKRAAHTFLQRKEHEKKQALALAQMRSDELWDELKARDQQIDQKIWKVVGKHPRSSHSKTRRSLTSSRSRTHPLVLKRRYLELQKALHGDDGEMKQLRTAAISYHKEQVRQAQLALWNTQPTLWPCEGYFSSPFGYRVHPVLGYARFHSGCDIAAGTGTPIYATAAGRVTNADYLGGYGLAVTIDHGNGLSTLYGHCSAVRVKTGDYVRKGQWVSIRQHRYVDRPPLPLRGPPERRPDRPRSPNAASSLKARNYPSGGELLRMANEYNDILPPLSSEDKMMAGSCYPFWPVIPIFVLLSSKRQDPFLAFHAVQALAVGLTTSVISVIGLFLLWISY